MNLAFRTTWPKDMPEHMSGKPTYFVEKIWTGFPIKTELWDQDYEKQYYDQEGWLEKGICPHPKIHTIRQDKTDRWFDDNLIHFVINQRKPNQQRFAPIIPCKSVQHIEILYEENDEKRICKVYVDFKIVGTATWNIIGFDHDPVIQGPKLVALAINDGFDTVLDFLSWFKEDFKGKLIHWTDKIY